MSWLNIIPITVHVANCQSNKQTIVINSLAILYDYHIILSVYLVYNLMCIGIKTKKQKMGGNAIPN